MVTSRLVPLVLLAVLVSACGYTLAGRGGGFPPEIRRIGVPMFRNESATPDLDRVVTEAVRLELRRRAPKVAVLDDANGADTVLTGTIRQLETSVSSVTAQRQQATNTITMRVTIELKDVKDAAVRCCPVPVLVREDFDVQGTTGANDPVSLFSQDANARQRMARRFAEQLVSQLLESY